MTKSTITRERLEALAVEDDLYNYPPTQEELNALARMALAAMDSEPVAIENFRSAIEGIGHIRRTLEETFGGLHGTHVEPDVLMDCKTICDAIYAAYSGNSPVIPDGYVMVPKEPTVEMVKKMRYHVGGYDRNIKDGYKAMLAAAAHDTPALNSVQSVDSVADTWIPVSERMPGKNQSVLISVNFDSSLVGPLICTARYTGSTFRRGDATVKPGAGIEEVTHWMPLPAAPQEVKGE
ncbi:DUF551 domain-containing protein [Klebsiella oxytoca]|uniref:DUF551 domain-containing protein n=1 Tax=Klebsiella oxytoca TaxID=571 RepID=UPI002FEF089E